MRCVGTGGGEESGGERTERGEVMDRDGVYGKREGSEGVCGGIRAWGHGFFMTKRI